MAAPIYIGRQRLPDKASLDAGGGQAHLCRMGKVTKPRSMGWLR